MQGDDGGVDGVGGDSVFQSPAASLRSSGCGLLEGEPGTAQPDASHPPAAALLAKASLLGAEAGLGRDAEAKLARHLGTRVQTLEKEREALRCILQDKVGVVMTDAERCLAELSSHQVSRAGLPGVSWARRIPGSCCWVSA